LQQFADYIISFTVANRIYVGDTGTLYFDNISVENMKLSLEEDVQIISFAFWDYGYFLSGQQGPASPAVNPSGWRSKFIVT